MPAPLLAARLTELRQSKGLSQKDIADYLGITREAYSHYERSTREPNLEVICKLTKLYHIEVSELINERTILAASNPKSITPFLLQLQGIRFLLKEVTRQLVALWTI